MRRHKTALLCAAVFALIAVCLSSCTVPVADFSLSFSKTSFAVDEAFPTEGNKIFVTFRNGASGYINVTADMVTGFDTATSGEKEMTVTYGGVSRRAEYTVTGNVITRARLLFSRGAGAECVMTLTAAEFPVYAVSFVLAGTTEDFPSDALPLPTGWKISMQSKENTVSVLLYTDNGNPISEKTMLLNFLCGAHAEFVATDIRIASDVKQYEVPNSELKNPEPTKTVAAVA